MAALSKVRANLALIFVVMTASAVGAQDTKVLHNFGDWRIERIDSNKSYLLVGVGDVKGDPRKFLGLRYFNIQCYEESDTISILVPYDRNPNDASNPIAVGRSVPLLVWTENTNPEEILFFQVNVGLLVAVSTRGDQTKIFIAKLERAATRFALGFEEKSIHFSMIDFKVAWFRFKQLCKMS